MDPASFSDRASGEVVRALKGHWAFLPRPLPPSIVWTPDLVAALSAADRALGRLAGIGQTLANPHLLIRPFMRREAVLSSRIEGTQASLSDLFFFEAAPSIEARVPDVAEVANYVAALEYGLERLADLPLSLRLIREMHRRLMTGVRGQELTPGEFRLDQNWIGTAGCPVDEAIYVPPPPERLPEALDAFEKYLHRPDDLPPLVRLAAIHYQFEAIHPFRDGNGRIGRLLIALLLCADDLLSSPLLYLSAYFERRRQEYYDRLLGVSQHGQWTEWLVFFLRGVAEQAADTIARASRLQALRDGLYARCQTARSSALLLKLVDNLFSYPATTIADATRLLGVTPAAAQHNVNRLIELGILREGTGQRRNRVFLADEIIRAIDEPIADDQCGRARLDT